MRWKMPGTLVEPLGKRQGEVSFLSQRQTHDARSPVGFNRTFVQQ
jgi:hypothetical protein